MPIDHFPAGRTFFLHAGGATYAMKVLPHEFLAHLYWGRTLSSQELDFVLPLRERPFSPNPGWPGPEFSLDTLPMEYPVYGTTDFRSPALEVYQPEEGSRIVDLRFKDYRIAPGKPALSGLPSTWVEEESEAQTLIIALEDSKLEFARRTFLHSLRRLPSYHALDTHPLSTESAPLFLRRALSCSVDFASAQTNSSFLHLFGAHIREREVCCTRLRPGIQSVESRRGASSHHHNPFFALTEFGTSEDHGVRLRI